jgi:hypothetical protein
MSFHNHETEEYNKRFGVEKRKADQKIIEGIEAQAQQAQDKRDKDIERDIMMLERLEQFDLTDKDIRWIRHLVGLPDGRGIPILCNWIQGRTGSCILHYDNRYVQNMPVGNFNERNIP